MYNIHVHVHMYIYTCTCTYIHVTHLQLKDYAMILINSSFTFKT